MHTSLQTRRGAHVPAHAHPGNHRALHLHVETARRVDIGKVEASSEPVLLQTVLGSCVAVCLYDPAKRIGGMNHILVPGSANSGRCGGRCGVHAMELLINALMNLGADRRRFVAKAFGAGNVLPVFSGLTVGEMNANFVRNFLETERIPLVGERLGGEQAVRVNFHTYTGKARVHTVDGSRLPKLIREETDWYNRDPREIYPVEEPILF